MQWEGAAPPRRRAMVRILHERVGLDLCQSANIEKANVTIHISQVQYVQRRQATVLMDAGPDVPARVRNDSRAFLEALRRGPVCRRASTH